MSGTPSRKRRSTPRRSTRRDSLPAPGRAFMYWIFSVSGAKRRRIFAASSRCCPSSGHGRTLDQIHVVDIPLDGPVKFLVPEIPVGTGSSTVWTIVLMPEATVDQDNFPVCGKYKVRCSRKIPTVQSQSESESMHDLADSNFRRCVAASYAPHQLTSLSRRKVVRHGGNSVRGSRSYYLRNLGGEAGAYSFRRPCWVSGARSRQAGSLRHHVEACGPASPRPPRPGRLRFGRVRRSRCRSRARTGAT